MIPTIHATKPDETNALLRLAEATGVFKPIEIQALREVLDDYHAENIQLGHQSVTLVRGGELAGFVYFAPAAMTDRTWYLYWIAVDPALQRLGLGYKLLEHAEREIRHAHGRQLLIETSSLEHYLPTRKFYERHGYANVAVVPDYYSSGDDMVIFRKVLGP